MPARDLGKLKTWAQSVAAGLGGLAAAGAFDDSVAWWALLVALLLTWISGLDYARSAPGVLRGKPGLTGYKRAAWCDAHQSEKAAQPRRYSARGCIPRATSTLIEIAQMGQNSSSERVGWSPQRLHMWETTAAAARRLRPSVVVHAGRLAEAGLTPAAAVCGMTLVGGSDRSGDRRALVVQRAPA